MATGFLNPTNAVGGLFIPGLTSARTDFAGALSKVGYERSTNPVGGIPEQSVASVCRLSMNVPPTPLVVLYWDTSASIFQQPARPYILSPAPKGEVLIGSNIPPRLPTWFDSHKIVTA
jgi:hypothetical protein